MYTESRARASTTRGRSTTSLSETLFDALLVLPVAEMNLEVIHCHAWPWGVELPWAVVAADTGEVLVFDLLAVLEVVGICNWG
jgi:hypothetical protein